MQIKKAIKKGFTLVELVVVIAVIAILAATSVGVYFGVTETAKKSNDQTVTNQMNKALLLDETVNGKPVTPSDALAVLEKNGFDVTKMTPFQDGAYYLWDSTENKMILINKEGAVDFPADVTIRTNKYEYFAFVDDGQASAYEGYSLYLKDGYTVDAGETFSTSVDGGNNTGLEINYVANSKVQNSIIKINGGVVRVNDSQDTVSLYGFADEAYVDAVSANTFNLYGEVEYLEVAANQHVVLMSGSNVTAIWADGTSDVDVNNGQTEDIISTSGDKNAVKDGATSFAGGLGTEAKPYLIKERKHLENISKRYDTYNYYKVVDGVETIDCDMWPKIYLNGSFDGNNVSLINLNYQLFRSVGYQLENSNIVIKNLEARMDGASALVGNIYNGGTTRFENVKIHGVIKGLYNIASFYNYGTANYDGVGCDYEVIFDNCISDAKIICTSGETAAGFLGHAYEGRNNSVTLRFNNSEYIGKMYLSNGAGKKGNKYFAMTSNYNNTQSHFFFNGVEDTFDNGDPKNYGSYENTTQISALAITKSNGYHTNLKQAANYVEVYINAQVDAYDGTTKIPNLSGITVALEKEVIENVTGESIKVYDKISSVNLINNAEEYSANLDGETLTVSLASSSVYKTGRITLQVTQYDSNNEILATGSFELATKSTLDGAWTIN